MTCGIAVTCVSAVKSNAACCVAENKRFTGCLQVLFTAHLAALLLEHSWQAREAFRLDCFVALRRSWRPGELLQLYRIFTFSVSMDLTFPSDHVL